MLTIRPAAPAEPGTLPVPDRRRRRLLVGAVLLSVVCVLGGVVGSVHVPPGGLAVDPAGAEACGMLDRWLRGGRVEPTLEIAERAVGPAYRSSTDAIRGSAGVIVDFLHSDGTCCYGFRVVDLSRLHRACVAAGADLPPY
jgi:hypothetical protein